MYIVLQTELISGDQNGNIRVWDLTANSCSCELVCCVGLCFSASQICSGINIANSGCSIYCYWVNEISFCYSWLKKIHADMLLFLRVIENMQDPTEKFLEKPRTLSLALFSYTHTHKRSMFKTIYCIYLGARGWYWCTVSNCYVGWELGRCCK